MNFSVPFATTPACFAVKRDLFNRKERKVDAKVAKRILFGRGGEMVSDKLRLSSGAHHFVVACGRARPRLTRTTLFAGPLACVMARTCGPDAPSLAEAATHVAPLAAILAAAVLFT